MQSHWRLAQDATRLAAAALAWNKRQVAFFFVSVGRCSVWKVANTLHDLRATNYPTKLRLTGANAAQSALNETCNQVKKIRKKQKQKQK